MTGIWTFLCPPRKLVAFFFFNDTATTEIYTLSLHDALPILLGVLCAVPALSQSCAMCYSTARARSEEHTSELQSAKDLVCRLLLEKKRSRIVLVPRHEGVSRRVDENEQDGPPDCLDNTSGVLFFLNNPPITESYALPLQGAFPI